MALTAARVVKTKAMRPDGGHLHKYGVKDGAVIYKGAFVCKDATDGFCKPVANAAAADLFLGIAQESANNTGGADGAIEVTVLCGPFNFEHIVASGVKASIGTSAFATADDTLALSGATATQVGRIIDNLNATTGLCLIRAYAPAGNDTVP